MPALLAVSGLNDIVVRAQAADAAHPIKVVCAWPVSGQYGPGSRVLYYVLVAACVVARKTEWLRNACLAAALLLPAVAAIHGLVLAAVHVNGAVDMDIYGAFQLCSIGVLAAPLTVRLSRTYFYDPGRNTIFLWTGLILAGLLSLTVEFYRVSPSDCAFDEDGQPLERSPNHFPYERASCNLTCSPEGGPHSPMRGGPSNNISVIPVPNRLTFNAAMLLAAACCIPAILSLIFTWDKILEINWKSRFPQRSEEQRMDELIEGTNGATGRKMKNVNSMVRFLLSVIEIPLFGGAVLAILCIGEVNFFSPQVLYQTEPIASVGQWAPIAGTSLAAVGSLYLLWMKKPELEEPRHPAPMSTHCNCSHDMQRHPTLTIHNGSDYSPSRTSVNGAPSHRSSNELSETISRPPPSRARTYSTEDPGGRRKVNKMLNNVADYLGSAAHHKFDMTAYKHSKAMDFPEIPAESQRNPYLDQIKKDYIQHKSRTASFAASINSAAEESSMPSPAIGSVSPPLESGSFPDTPRGRPPRRRDTLEVPTPSYHRPSLSGHQRNSSEGEGSTRNSDEGRPPP